MQKPFTGKHILIIVENLPLPFDRRVWQEANTLKENGAEVSIICPRMKGYTKKYEEINGIHIYRHPLPVEGDGAWGYLREYSAALFYEWWYSLKIFFRKRFHVIQGCNPPDLIFIVAIFFKIFGVKYVFDHHDINPELYTAKYDKKTGFFYKFLVVAERFTFKTANYSIATNESYKAIAIGRGKMPADKVQVIRSGPKLDRLKRGPGNADKKGRRYMVGYVGVIGEQEGLDLLLESVKYIVAKRQDVQFAIVGGGTELEKLKQLAIDMQVSDYVDFYGRVDDATLLNVLNTADVCVNPDKPTEMNNLSTMNKIMEYMSLAKPIVQYDLKEGKFSAQQASLYAENTSTADFAEKIIWLLDNPAERQTMGEFGYNRVRNELSWDYEGVKLVKFYNRVFTGNNA